MGTALSAANPSPLRIVQRMANGSIVVELPVLRAGTLDLSLAAKGKGQLAVTRAMLEEIAANYGEWPGPIPVNVAPHREWSETSGPAPGFIDALSVRGDDLWARMTLNGWLAVEVESGAWRGFSVDLARNPKLAAKAINGWAVWGGVFTNRPAGDVNFRVEASAAAESSADLAFAVALTISTERESSEGGPAMKTAEELALEVTQLTKDLTAKAEEVTTLTSKVEKLEADVVKANAVAAEKASLSGRFEADMTSLQGQLRTAQNETTALTAKVATLEADVRAKATEIDGLKKAALQGRIKGLVQDGLRRGIPAAVFEGCDKDPVAMLEAKFGGAFAALESLVTSYPAKPKPSSVSSGHQVDDTEAVALSAEELAEMKRHGLDTRYANVNEPADLGGLKK